MSEHMVGVVCLGCLVAVLFFLCVRNFRCKENPPPTARFEGLINEQYHITNNTTGGPIVFSEPVYTGIRTRLPVGWLSDNMRPLDKRAAATSDDLLQTIAGKLYLASRRQRWANLQGALNSLRNHLIKGTGFHSSPKIDPRTIPLLVPGDATFNKGEAARHSRLASRDIMEGLIRNQAGLFKERGGLLMHEDDYFNNIESVDAIRGLYPKANLSSAKTPSVILYAMFRLTCNLALTIQTLMERNNKIATKDHTVDQVAADMANLDALLQVCEERVSALHGVSLAMSATLYMY